MSNKNLPAVQTRKDIRSLLSSPDVQGRVAEVLPKHLTAERMTRVMLYSLDKTPDLVNCTPSSLLRAMMKCSMMGVEPDGHHAHLIPYGQECQLIVDYKGLIRIAADNGIKAKGITVHENDEFKYCEDDGSGKTVVTHSFDPLKPRGKIVGAYSRSVDKDGFVDYEFMTIDEIEAIKRRSRSSSKGPWVTDYEEMVKKTPLRRHSKRWDLRSAPMAHSALDTEDDGPARVEAEEVTKPLLPAQSETRRETSAVIDEKGTDKPKDTPPIQSAETVTESTKPTEETKPVKEDVKQNVKEEQKQESPSEKEENKPEDKSDTVTAKTKLMQFVGENEITFEDFIDFARVAYQSMPWSDVKDYPDITETMAGTMMSDAKFLKRVKQYLGKK